MDPGDTRERGTGDGSRSLGVSGRGEGEMDLGGVRERGDRSRPLGDVREKERRMDPDPWGVPEKGRGDGSGR